MLDFQKQVIEKSHEKPVLIDFWAQWCGPCRVLGPVIEQVAKEQSNRWELVKVNTEEHPELVQQYSIRGIPNVKLFHKGEVINEFSGALSKHQLEQWLAANLPNPSAGELQAILNEDNAEEKEAQLRKFVTERPDNQEAKLALAKQVVFNNPQEAVDLVDGIHLGDPLFDDAEDIKVMGKLMEFESDNGSVTASHLVAARDALKSNDPETAIQKIIAATMADKSFQNDLPRRAAIALFHIWGREHELTMEYRRQFDMALY